MGLSDDEFHRISTSSFIPDPGIGPYVRGDYHPRTLPNGIAYLLAFGTLALPPLGLIAILSAGRGWRQGRRGAPIALLCAVLATAIGVVLWLTVLPTSPPS